MHRTRTATDRIPAGPEKGRRGTSDAIRSAAMDLYDYCKRNDWSGYDPYDGLTSPLFQRFSVLRNRPARLAFIQFMKRSAINFRPLAGIRHGQNPKALALFSMALVRMMDLGLINDTRLVRSVIRRLIDNKTPGVPYAGWGYNFDWQTRSMLVPRATPNIICTTFAGNALLDAYEAFGDPVHLKIARNAGNFLMRGLHIARDRTGICFSYTPLDTGQVHNANLLGAAFLARLHGYWREQELVDHALQAARYSTFRQTPEGAWVYGEGNTQQWIDNFHTGYNLMALRGLARSLGTAEFEDSVARGFAYYKQHFFEGGCMAKYYHDRLYPIDIHSIAQSMITLTGLGREESDRNLAYSVCGWALENMRHKSGYFYYQKTKYYTNRISYMRWTQAWMLLALAELLKSAAMQEKKGERGAKGSMGRAA